MNRDPRGKGIIKVLGLLFLASLFYAWVVNFFLGVG